MITLSTPIIKTIPGKYDVEKLVLEITRDDIDLEKVIHDEPMTFTSDYYLKNMPVLFHPIADATDENGFIYLMLSNYEFIKLDPKTMTCTKLKSSPVQYNKCTMTYLNGAIYIAGGVNSALSTTTGIYAYNISSGTWSASLGTLTYAVSSPAYIPIYVADQNGVYTQDKNILYIYSGRKVSNNEYSAQMFNVNTKTLTLKDQLKIFGSISDKYTYVNPLIYILKIATSSISVPHPLCIQGKFTMLDSSPSTMMDGSSFITDIYGPVPTMNRIFSEEETETGTYSNEFQTKMMGLYDGSMLGKGAILERGNRLYAFCPEAGFATIVDFRTNTGDGVFQYKKMNFLHNDVYPITIGNKVMCFPLKDGSSFYTISFKDVVMKYTTDGSDPASSETASVYLDKTEISLNKNIKVRAITTLQEEV